MNTVELQSELRFRHVPDDAYSIGQDRDEAYCLIDVGGAWHVYYSERGNRNDERTFASEEDACRDLLNRLLDDGSVRERTNWST